jgi:predicted transcriptional regulator
MGQTSSGGHGSEREAESATERVLRRQRVGSALAEAGYEDVLVLSHESADRALTPARRAVIRALQERTYESQNELAATLDRDAGNVKRDLDVLVEEDIVRRVQDGKSKRPVLKHATILAEPVVSARTDSEPA